MKGSSAPENPELLSIREQAAELGEVRHSDFDGETETRRKLNAHGLDDDEIARQMSTLRSNTAGTTAVLTSYSLLHSLQHLDNILDKTPRLSSSAEGLITLFRCAEVCIYNIGVLSEKMTANLERGLPGPAMSSARWRAAFHEVLYRLSSLVVEVSDDPASGALLSIRDSQIHANYLRNNAELHDVLRAGWPEEDADIFRKDLDDPKRYVFFSEFVNSSDERVWASRLDKVRLPGVTMETGESPAAFYERMVCSSEIEAMMKGLETEADTDLLSFRAVHQISETIAGYINSELCGVIERTVSTESPLADSDMKKLIVANRLLSIVDESIKLLMRALTPRSYKDIRPNLGMVRGTSSVVLRKTLFNTTYPLLVRAFKLRLCGFESDVADDDEAVHSRCVKAIENREANEERVADMMQQLIVFHQHIRTWRDNHQQLPKTHLGMSPFQGRPTVSLSGSGSAVDIAHGLRKAHASDPILPLYKAMLGTAPPDVHELLTPGGFEEHMAHATARAVLEVYADVQERFYDRVSKKAPLPAR